MVGLLTRSIHNYQKGQTITLCSARRRLQKPHKHQIHEKLIVPLPTPASPMYACSMQSGNLAQSADCTLQSADCTVAVQSADCMPCSLQTARGPFQWEHARVCFGEITSKKTERIVMIL